MSGETMTVDREAVLKRRAERLAQIPRHRNAGSPIGRVALIEVQGQLFGLPTEGLREIVRVPQVVPLPDLPPALEGICQIRGELIGVADLAILLGMSSSAPGCLAIVEGDGGALGLLADHANGFREIYAEDRAEGFSQNSGGERLIAYVTRDLVSVLDLARLLASDQVRVPER